MVLTGTYAKRRDGNPVRWAVILLWLVIFVGFARSFYLRPIFHPAPLILLLQMHGLVMTAWMVLFGVQTILIARGRSDLHRALGFAGVLLAALLIVVGLATLFYSIVQHHGVKLYTAEFFQDFVAFDGVSLLLFAGFVAAAIYFRKQAALHRRLMLLATVNLVPPALGRAVALFTHQHVEEIVFGTMITVLLAVLVLDYTRNHSFHRVFLFGCSLMAADYAATFYFQVLS
jgi:hypothetical protein